MGGPQGRETETKAGSKETVAGEQVPMEAPWWDVAGDAATPIAPLQKAGLGWSWTQDREVAEHAALRSGQCFDG